MATVADGTFAGEGAPGVPPPIGCGESRLVLVGGSTCAGPSELGGAGRAPTARRRPALIVLDLDRRTFVIAPHVASGEVRVALIGELDIGTSPMFVDAIALALRHRPALLVLDMRRLSFIDVRGAGAIATASERMGEWGGELLAREAPAATRRALGLCGLDHLMSPLRVPPASLRRIPRGKASSRPAWEQTASA
jgi:anti-anti-sigma factor